jgi:hypothetical protein
VGGSFFATAPIGSDGTFVLTNSSTSSDPIQITINGAVPSDGAPTWQGSYKLTTSASTTSCVFNQSGSFSATQYPAFQGSYVGTITSGKGIATGTTISLQVSQSPPTFAYLGSQSTPFLYLPLTGTVTMSGSPCFSSGTFSQSANSVLTADSFLMSISGNDGSLGQIQGWFSDQTETTLQPFSINFSTGPCSGDFGNAVPTLQR